MILSLRLFVASLLCLTYTVILASDEPAIAVRQASIADIVDRATRTRPRRQLVSPVPCNLFRLRSDLGTFVDNGSDGQVYLLGPETAAGIFTLINGNVRSVGVTTTRIFNAFQGFSFVYSMDYTTRPANDRSENLQCSIDANNQLGCDGIMTLLPASFRTCLSFGQQGRDLAFGVRNYDSSCTLRTLTVVPACAL